MIFRIFEIIVFALRAFYFLKISRNYGGFIDLIESMGPVFIKFAQSISTRTDILDEGLAVEILRVCDKIKPPKFIETKKIIESEFKLPIEEVFYSVEIESIASASIATVYKGVTLEGNLVCIKVLKPKVEKFFKRDVRVLFLIARIATLFGNKNMKFLQIVQRFANASKFELDLRFEAANATNLRKNLQNDLGVYVPQVFWKRTSKRVLTMEYVSGLSLTDFINKGKSTARDVVAKNLIVSFFKQVYRDGFFHADLHPGNLIIMNDSGRIAFIDFGIMGRISEDNKVYMLEVVNSLLNRDYQMLAEIHFKRGYVNRSELHFVTACMALGEPLLEKSLNEIFISEILGQTLKIISNFNVEINVELLLLKKNLLFLEGNCLKLDPQINMWDTIRPLVAHWYKEHISVANVFKNTINEFCSTFLTLKGKLKNETKNNNQQIGNMGSVYIVLVVLNTTLIILCLIKEFLH